MNIKTYETDSAKTEDGAWLEFDGAKFLVRSTKGRQFQRFIATATRKHTQAELKRNPGIFTDITNDALATCVLLDWVGVMNGDEVLPCTLKNKAALIAMPEFRDWLADAAADMDNFRREALAADADALKSGGPVGAEVE